MAGVGGASSSAAMKATAKKSLYRPPWPTKLDTTHAWEKEDAWEKHIGDVVDRLVKDGQRSFLRESRLQDPHLAFKSSAWKKARRLGVELFDLRARFRVVYVQHGHGGGGSAPPTRSRGCLWVAVVAGCACRSVTGWGFVRRCSCGSRRGLSQL